MRAREPDRTGHVELDGVRVGYEVAGDGRPALLLLPSWQIVHSRQWKAQVPCGGQRTTPEQGDRGRRGLRAGDHFPLGHHVEQQLHVPHRRRRYRAGRRMEYASTGPDELAAAIAFAVARAVVDMARAMGRATVAEGVEAAEQFRAARDRVEAYQGWLFARAVAPADLRAMLAGDRLAVPAEH